MTDSHEADDDAMDQLADDLSRLLAGEMPEHAFRDAWQQRDAPAFLGAVWDNLEHYLADADIRSRDADYRATQDAELTKLIRLLRERGSVTALGAITFLGGSGR